MTLGSALLIGVAQALALIPGTSRSGVTMTAAPLPGLHPARLGALLVPARHSGDAPAAIVFTVGDALASGEKVTWTQSTARR